MSSKQNPVIAANPGAVQQGQMLRFLSRHAAGVTGHAENGADKCDPSTQRPAAAPGTCWTTPTSDLPDQRPAAGAQIHEGAIHGAKY